MKGNGVVTGITACPEPRDIRNKTTDTCISKTVETALSANKDIEGMLAGIIQRFDASKTVTINIFNGSTQNDAPGQYQGEGFVNNVFQANITLNTTLMSGSSKEYAISVLIHEFVHAYIHTSGNPILQSDHNTIASKYITPMASYLTQYFEWIAIKYKTR
ncbi:hypothetical protein [Pedobacter insulae]|uniref:SprT-like family protein n=1 Tax=Pedobacter insulae TaxID=414048 RepID=A0A1I2X6N8_9SPHI|nr:hypothetical protein [Pedobacter insulae]SFH08639.1 hypothetical protein SAMN04489864_1054 [Pedobacter insulae]